MAVEKIRIFPDSVLREKAGAVTAFNRSLIAMIKTLHATMRAQPAGIGIAAPQIGISKQLALVDVSARRPGAQLIILINPRILELRDTIPSREGCMSLPDYTANISRYNWVRFMTQNVDGSWTERIAEGIEAVCIQHEIDHLNGILFLDRVVSLKTDMIPRKITLKRNPK